jgi:hypothetical protein
MAAPVARTEDAKIMVVDEEKQKLEMSTNHAAPLYSSGYARMKVSTPTQFLGYLAMSQDWTNYNAILVSDAKKAYGYKWVNVSGGLRLDQDTSGGARSLSYASIGVYPCFGLGSNWVVLKHGADHSISFEYNGSNPGYKDHKGTNYLCGSINSNNLYWSKDTSNKLKFELDSSSVATASVVPVSDIHIYNIHII